MVTFEQLMQSYVNTDYSNLVAIAKTALEKIMPDCRRVDTENNGYMMLMAIIMSAIGADGKLTALERRFLAEVLQFDDEAVDKLTSLYNPDMAGLVDKFADNMSQETKVNTTTLLLALVSCDEKISREETAFIKKIIE